MHATAVTASHSMPAAGAAQRAYKGQLLQLLRALPSRSIVPFLLVPDILHIKLGPEKRTFQIYQSRTLYRLDALLVAQPTESKYRRVNTKALDNAL